ncbi:hypothetical protein [Mariniradius sediminis]|jgi:hypothetical protein|uniref:Uncharacterized protein n=1 Tax=Mariniradius sediminis TaxID=2909237 RepID=A0ABS9BQX5_9BACT|nr:hypothetical protein [Mariniradius sediminis]MCF1749880.1 hypothetical protein [Mariniradius sediminis]
MADEKNFIFSINDCDNSNFWIVLEKSGEKWGKVVESVFPFLTFVTTVNSR